MKVVIGFGKTGLSCIRYLVQQNETVVAMDSRQQPPNFKQIAAEFPDIEMITGRIDLAYLLRADEVIVSPGISLKTPEISAAQQQGVSCIGDVELFARHAQAPIVAITGSNGKTTVTTLMGQLLVDAGYRVEVCGNIGTPVLDVLANAVPDYYVMELSSFQLETTSSLKARVAVVLNVTADHMDRYDSLDDYAAAKLRIYQNCQTAIVNADEPYTKQLMNSQQVLFSSTLDTQADYHLQQYQDELYFYHQQQPLFPVKELPCQGLHHYQNTLAVLAMGAELHIPMHTMHKTLSQFVGLPHRCQKVASAAGVDWYNDSKATNLGATVAAVNSLSPLYKNLVLIAGGDAKGADLSELGPLAVGKIGHVILLGQAAADLEKIFADYVPTTRVNSLSEAVSAAATHTQAQTAVLLSPACASWDMFANYEERGNLFTRAVQEVVDADGSSR